jgi:putative nucleotidyltransferase with HDIG domain
MELPFLKMFRKKKVVSRNERVEKYANSHSPLRMTLLKGMIPRLALGLIFVVAGILLLPPTQRIKDVDFKVGEIADQDIIAPFDFQVSLTSDEMEFGRLQQAMSVPPVYVRNSEIQTSLTRGLTAVLDSIGIIISRDNLDAARKSTMIGALLPYVASNASNILLTKSIYDEMRSSVLSQQRRLLKNGLIDNSGPLRRNEYPSIVVLDGEKESRVPVKDIIDQGRLDQVLREASVSQFKLNREKADLFFEIIRMHLLPNLILDIEETQRRRNVAMEKVPRFFEVSKNQKIVGKYAKVTSDQVKMLGALEVARASRRTQNSPLIAIGLYTGEALRLSLFIFLIALYLIIYHRKIYDDLLKLTAIFSVMMIYLVLLAVIIRFSLNPFLIPVAFVSLMIAALFSYRLGVLATIMACILIPLLTNISYNVSFVALLAGVTAIIGLKHLQSRSRFYTIFLYVSLAYVLGIVSIELGQIEKFETLYSHWFWGIANGLFSTVSVMFLLPVFENMLNLTTRFTLLELTDLNKPILKRMNMDAHGTYHHSMLIGNMVDSIATTVGADSLRARVMAYYHDIGKIIQPGYYSENQDPEFNKHEKITPKMSSLILLSHVKDGVELAREEKLPDLVIDAIKEHHGTTVMAFFYQKALETDSHSSVNEDDFRYPGPRPQSKESAILMLADSVEAACRSIKDPTKNNIRSMITKIVDTRARDGELDHSGLTMKDLAEIKRQFVSILSGLYHKRVAYPGQEDEEAEQGAADSKSIK